MIKSGSENEKSFIKAWELEKERKKGKCIPLSCPDAKVLFYSEWGKLGTQLKRILNIVPREQIKIILFEDFALNPKKVYQDVLDFLNLPDDGRQEFPRINERRVIKYFIVHRLSKTLSWRLWRPVITVITKGKGIGPIITRKQGVGLLEYIFNKWNSAPADKKIDPEIYGRIVSFYKEEILILEELLKRNLSHWLELPKNL
jgi:hypothetical protein